LALTISNCGGSASVIGNSTICQTNVELYKKSFNVLGAITGVSTNTYILGIGGSGNRALVQKAKNEMVKKANLSGSKAIVNVTYDKHYNGFIPFFSKITVTASANIVEFTE
jgi:uncharacterized protein YbjQ (UPF0145 family)